MSETLVGVLVGGGIGIVGTALSLLFNWFQGAEQRRFAMRQEVYLDACDWAARGIEYLASFARLDLTDAQLGQILQGGGSAAYKVHVVGEQSTVAAFTAATEYLATQAVDLTASRLRLLRTAQRIHDLESEAEQTSQFLQQSTSLIEHIPSPSPSDATPGLVSGFTRAREHLLELREQIAALRTEGNVGHYELLAAALRATVGYQDHLVKANVAARRELGLPIDETSYRSSLQRSSERILAAVERMIEQLRAAE